MFREIKAVYWSGWRAGMCGSQPDRNPFGRKNFLLRHAWEEGRHSGLRERIVNYWKAK